MEQNGHLDQDQHQNDSEGSTLSSSAMISNEIDTTDVSDVREVAFTKDNSGLSIVIPAKVNGKPIKAVVDSAAQVTVLSETLYKAMKHPPEIRERVRLKGAGDHHHMMAGIVKNVRLSIGEQTFNWDIYVAPITDEFILGLDFMVKYNAVVDLSNNTFSLDGKTISAVLKKNGKGEQYQVSRVFLKRKVVIPPNSVVRAVARFDHKFTTPYILQAKGKQRVLIPQSIGSEGEEGIVCLVNDTDHFVRLKKKHLIGTAETFDKVIPDEVIEDVARVATLNVKQHVTSIPHMDVLRNTMPDHLQDLFGRSLDHVSTMEAEAVAELLSEFSDFLLRVILILDVSTSSLIRSTQVMHDLLNSE